MNEVEILLTDILKCRRIDLYLNKLSISPEQKRYILEAIIRRLRLEPLQYILGKTEFMGLEFKVASSVFIPRPETEILVEEALKIICNLKSTDQPLRVLDLGTGSGCIAISLAKYASKKITIDAVDISKEALELAKLNAELNKVKVNFFKSNLFKRLKPLTYDLIVSNPPYLSKKEIPHLSREITYEPPIALEAGVDGLKFLYRIIKKAPLYLKEKGYLILEIGYNQLHPLRNLFENNKYLKIIDIVKDYCNIERIIVAKKYG
ncbi:MAG: peptide chain release factor N(5)-glutamine methyltransferase [Candidatus Omnitrophica bacterium]|nr:peptide chain release factor N(5)-glutamine methyltransferase [Candidatus Omnitrophota bacterium]MCM8799389.1 peptide chain release factor N(5)-glutamine methyltransferase [Candidatus Omnitrophota bacterium]